MVIAVIGFLLAVFLVYKFGTLISGEIVHYFYGEPDAPEVGRLTAEEYKNIQVVFFKTVFKLLGMVAKSDGHIDKTEIKLTESYMEKMDLDALQRQEAIRYFKEGASPNIDKLEALKEFGVLAQRNPNLTEILLVYMVNLARVDGVMSAVELKVLYTVADALGFSSIAFDHLVRMIASQNRFSDSPLGGGSKSKPGASSSSDNFKADQKRADDAANYETRSNDLVAAYEALGLETSVSWEEVKKAYRRLMGQYHPDKLTGQGLPEFMIKAATERTKKIQAAYNYIKKCKQH